jgi:sec-independent protein translocase protein TatB
MEFLGVGPTELLFIIIIALIVLGPKDLAKTGGTVGKWLNNLIQSDGWKAIRKTSDELRRLPTQLLRDDNLKKFLTPEEVQQAADQNRDELARPAATNRVPFRADPSTSLRTSVGVELKNENTIHSPVEAAGPLAKTLKPAKKKPSVTTHKKSPAAKKTKKKPTVKPSSRAPRKKPNA